MRLKSLAFILLVVLLSGCGLREREIALDKKSKEIAEKEQELLLEEKQLALREAELHRRELVLDSSRMDSLATDSLQPFNPQFAGTWSARMQCTETTCPGSAVGDTKIEQWIIIPQDNAVLVKALVNNNLVRVYTGGFVNNRLMLKAQQDSANTPTIITAMLMQKGEEQLEGSREIRRINDCQIVYKLDLERL